MELNVTYVDPSGNDAYFHDNMFTPFNNNDYVECCTDIHLLESNDISGNYNLENGINIQIEKEYEKYSLLLNDNQNLYREVDNTFRRLKDNILDQFKDTDIFIENAVGTYSLPLGIATNFLINNKDILVPMAVEESSVLAAASHGAKLARIGGGFTTSSTEPIMTGQIQLYVPSEQNFDQILQTHKSELLDYANQGQDRLLRRGGGAKDIDWYYIEEISSLVVNLHIHTGDAMGANIVNTMCEKISIQIAALLSCTDIGLRILTNLTDRKSTRLNSSHSSVSRMPSSA